MKNGSRNYEVSGAAHSMGIGIGALRGLAFCAQIQFSAMGRSGIDFLITCYMGLF